MPLDFQLVDIAFTQGMDTHTNKKLVVPGKWNLLRDCTLSEDGSLTKRDGITSMISGATGLGNGLATFNNELLTVNGSVVRSVSSPTLNPGTVAPTAQLMPGQLGFVDVTKKQIRRSSGYQEGMDIAHGGGFTCYVWSDFTAAGAFNGVYVTVLDEATGTPVLAATQMLATGNRVRVVFSVDGFYVFYKDATNLYCRAITVTAGVLVYGAQTALITSASLVDANFDCVGFMEGAAGSVGVSYVWGDGVTSVRAIRVTQAGAVPVISTGPVALITEAEIPNASIMGLATCTITGTLGHYATFVFAIAGGATSGTVVKILDNTFASAAAYLQIDATVPAAGTFCHITAVGQAAFPVAACFTDQQSSLGGAAAVQPLRRTEISFSGGIITVISTATLINSVVGVGGGPTIIAPPQGVFICGKAFASGTWDTTGAGALASGRIFLPVCILEVYGAASTNTINQQNTCFLLDAATGVVVAKALYGTYGVPAQFAVAPLVYTPSSVPTVNVQTSANFSTFALACTERGQLTFNDGINITQTGLTRLTFIPRNVTPMIRTQLGAGTYFAGGSLSMYDGQAATEAGFPLFPEGIGAVVSAGGAMTVGVHQVVAVYEWVDGQGQRHQSAPSLPVSFTITGGNQTCTVTTPTLMLSQKAGISIVLFMTQAAGTIFNRVTSIGAPVLNNTAAASVNQAVIIQDADFAGNELLYTQPLQSGTTLPNDAPGPTSTLAVHQNRLFVDLTDRPGTYRYSQALIPGIGLQWNETLSGTTPVDGGAIVGFADLDEKMLIFCARKIYAIVGTGPLPNGSYSNYSEPIEVPSDTGCSDARSILRMPDGVIFKSTKGWYRVGRDLTVRYVGEAVASYDIYSVFSASFVEDRQEARFTCGLSFHFGTGSEIGVTLVYSYLENQWSVSTYNMVPAVGAPRTYLAYDAVWWTTLGAFCSISLADGLNRDVPGVYSDSPGTGAATSVKMFGRTSFLHMTKMEGFQRVRWLYLTASFPSGASSLLGVSITVDYDDVYSAVTPPGSAGAYTATGSQLLAVYGAGESIDFRHKLHRQKCKSVAFTFEDTGAFAGFVSINGFQALALEVGMKRGTNKLPATQTVA